MSTPVPPPPGGLRQILAARRYRGPVSDHFDGKRFHNLGDVPHGGLLALLRWQLGRLWGRAGQWPRWIDIPPGPPPPERVEGDGLRVTFVNHSTTLLQTGGLNVLTDPIWSGRSSPFTWGGPSRHRPPGLRFEDLPPIDTVLLSHNHYDHLDLPTLLRLRREHAPRFVVPLGVGPFLAEFDVGPVTEMDWWQEESLPGDLTAACVPAQHFSGRGLRDRDATLWCGYVLRGPAGPVYYAGQRLRPALRGDRRTLRRARLALRAHRRLPAGLVHVPGPRLAGRGGAGPPAARGADERGDSFRDVSPRRRRGSAASRGIAARAGAAGRGGRLLGARVRRGARRAVSGRRSRNGTV